MDLGVRKSMSLNLKNKIIILDEAHNVEMLAEDACSTELEVDNLLATLKLK